MPNRRAVCYPVRIGLNNGAETVILQKDGIIIGFKVYDMEDGSDRINDERIVEG